MLESARSFLQLLLQPPLVYAVVAGWLALFLVGVLLGRYMNRRYVVLRRSESIDQIAFELGRIASALESIATAQARPRTRAVVQPAAPPLPKRPRVPDHYGDVGLSMFGR